MKGDNEGRRIWMAQLSRPAGQGNCMGGRITGALLDLASGKTPRHASKCDRTRPRERRGGGIIARR